MEDLPNLLVESVVISIELIELSDDATITRIDTNSEVFWQLYEVRIPTFRLACFGSK